MDQRMDFEEHRDQEEEMEVQQPKMGPTREGGASAATARRVSSGGGGVRYRECLKNHAVGIGGSAVDGCLEFLAAGTEGTLDALKCAACNCHRNFHRKEVEGEVVYAPPYQNQYSPPLYRPPPPSGYLHISGPGRPLALPAASGGRDDEDNPSSSGGGSFKKRFRTKFTPEQKDKMLEFAERIGWRIQKHDEGAVEQFCAENGVKRHVFKVWMHNNKNTLGKKP